MYVDKEPFRYGVINSKLSTLTNSKNHIHLSILSQNMAM